MNLKQTKKYIALFLILPTLALSAAAQQQTKRKLKIRLPRVGVIKNYEATGLAAGCGNLYFTRPRAGGETVGEKYVYLARASGADAWLNLDGRDTALKLLKTENKKNGWRFFYRARKTLITISITKNDLSAETGDRYDVFSMIINLRRGKISRRIKAVGSSDC